MNRVLSKNVLWRAAAPKGGRMVGRDSVVSLAAAERFPVGLHFSNYRYEQQNMHREWSRKGVETAPSSKAARGRP